MCLCRVWRLLGGRVEIRVSGQFRRPQEGQSLVSFLSSQDFHTCTDLDRVCSFPLCISLQLFQSYREFYRLLLLVHWSTETCQLSWISVLLFGFTVCLSICLSVCLPTCLLVCLFVCFTVRACSVCSWPRKCRLHHQQCVYIVEWVNFLM